MADNKNKNLREIDKDHVRALRGGGTRYTISSADIGLLRVSGVTEDDITHSVKVSEKALEIAYRTNGDLDFEFIGRGALFHDLGKAKTHDIEHGKIGAEMGKATYQFSYGKTYSWWSYR